MKDYFLFTFGCNLDHSNIEYLVKERLGSFVRPIIVNNNWTDQNPKIRKDSNVHFTYDVYDVNDKKHNENLYYIKDYYISEEQLFGFEYSLRKLKGNHIWCHPNTRGHFNMKIEEIEYTGHIYVTINNDIEIRLLDREVPNSLRGQIHLVPEKDQWIELPRSLTEEEKDKRTLNWIEESLIKVEKM
ncbi:hypothetical protein NST21_12875 [Peribacillus sp. FSL K6-1552]|uniref:hypothetical protein n=1 Tax=Peribacillus sp. FSL K6-1552 TaxID=2954514 RepID=UPI0030F9F2DE